MLILTATHVVTTPASPLWTVLATLGGIAAVWVGYLGYRLTKRQDRSTVAAEEQAKKDVAGALEQTRQQQMAQVVQTLDGLHGALWGRMEGTTKVPGIAEVVVGDGNGNKDLRTIANTTQGQIKDLEERQLVIGETVNEARLNAAKAVEVAAEVAANAERLIKTHLEDDMRKFKGVEGRLEDILTVAREALHGVETINGLTLGQLAERGEGRDIATTVPPGKRTKRDKSSADHTLGHSGSPEPKRSTSNVATPRPKKAPVKKAVKKRGQPPSRPR